MGRTGQNIIYQDFSSIYKRIMYSKSKRLEMLDTKKGNCTIFAVKIKAWNHTTDLCLCFFVAKTVFSLDAAYNQLYFGCAVCS